MGKTDVIELGGKYQTRDGRAVRILATDMRGGGCFTIIGLIQNKGQESIMIWLPTGLANLGNSNGPSDLIPAPTKHEGWCLVDTLAPTYPTRARAERAFDEGNYAVTPIGNPRYRIVFYTWED